MSERISLIKTTNMPKRRECVNKFENEQDCPCSEFDCERHGVCCECIAYHRARKEKPACLK